MHLLSCPYCNSPVTIPERVEAGQRVHCPRCGEAFAFHGGATSLVSGDRGTGGPAGGPALDQPSVTVRQRWSNRAVAAAVLGFMGVMAAVGLWYALYSQKDRRSRDPVNPLGYLPADCNVVLALNLPLLLKEPAGQKLAEQSFPFGPASVGVADLERWTGLKREEINQVIIGLKMEGKALPGMVLVVQTRDPYDEEALRTILKAHHAPRRGQKAVSSFDLGNLQAELWCPAQNILVIGCLPDRLNEVPDTPYPGIDHLAVPLQPLLRDRLDPNAQAWAVAHSDQWVQTLAGSFVQLLVSDPEDLKVLSQVHTAGLWVRCEQETLGISSAFDCKDTESARAFRDYLVRQNFVEEPDAQVQKDTWVMARGKTKPENVRRMLDQSSKKLKGPWNLFRGSLGQ
jgi:hypothetical protein